jgi:hypothetical protein
MILSPLSCGKTTVSRTVVVLLAVFCAALFLDVQEGHARAASGRLFQVERAQVQSTGKASPDFRRVSVASAASRSMLAGKSAPAPSQVNVVALMVEFQPDTTRFTTGTGTFEGPLFEGTDPPRLDPLPHNAAYFDAHLQFLEHYINKVSDGRTSVDTYVIPEVVRVSGKMGSYSPTGFEAGSDVELSKLAGLVKEAWTLAEAAGVQLPAGLNSENTAFVLFHAGVGRDIELLGTTLEKTPEDLPSLFFGSSTLERLGVNGLSVDGVAISNSLVIPRTESRLGYDFIAEEPFLVELSINGLLAASFLNYLGVPDLFNTETGESAIGPFDVMDALGIFAFGGLFPPEPSAWTKSYLGWADVTSYPTAEDLSVSLTHTGAAARNEVAKIPVSDAEYFLVENRHRDPEGDGVHLKVWKNGTIEDVVYPNADPGFNDVTISGYEGGVVVSVDQYDFALPGGVDEFGNPLMGGLLIWHVDENRLRTGIATNRVNADPSARGIDLEEADSAQDIGYTSNGGFFGPQYELGSPFDFWFESNPVAVRTSLGRDIKLYQNRFASDTTPSSHANNGTQTNVALSAISDPAPEMTFVLDRRGELIWNVESEQSILAGDGFFETGSAIGVLSSEVPVLQPFAFGGAASASVFTDAREMQDLRPVPPASGPFGLVAVSEDGFKWMDTTGRERSVAVSTPFIVTSNLAWYQEEGSYRIRVGVLTSSGPAMAEVRIGPGGQFSASLESVSSRVDHIVQRSRNASTAFLQVEGGLIDELDGGSLVAVSALSGAAAQVGGTPTPGASRTDAIRLDAATTPLGWTAAFTDPENSTLHILDASGQRFETTFYPDSQCIPGRAVLANLNEDARSEVVVACGAMLYGFYDNGVLMGGFPVQLDGEAFSAPVVGFDSNTETPTIYVQTGDGNLDAFSVGSRIERLPGFPLPVGRPSAAAPFIMADRIVTLSANGSLKTWTSSGAGILSVRNATDLDVVLNLESISLPSEGVSKRLLDHSETYNWPNPISQGQTHIRFMTSEAAVVTVTVIDGAGGLVKRFESVSTLPNVPTEVIWDTSDGSGLYIARIQAKSVQGGRSDNRLVKMAIVR